MTDVVMETTAAHNQQCVGGTVGRHTADRLETFQCVTRSLSLDGSCR